MEYKTDKRLNYVPLTETYVVSAENPYLIKLKEIPDVAGNISIANMIRVYSMPKAITEFYASRTGEVYFHQGKKNATITISYMGGGSRLSASDWNQMIDELTRANNLINGLTSLVFGNVRIRVTPSVIASTALQLNQSVNNSFFQTFTCSLVTNSNTVYTWLPDIPLYLTVTKTTVDSDIAAPTITPAISSLKFVQGVCQFTATYQTDYGAYKKYTPGDYVRYDITTVDPTTSVGINLTTTVMHSIQ